MRTREKNASKLPGANATQDLLATRPTWTHTSAAKISSNISLASHRPLLQPPLTCGLCERVPCTLHQCDYCTRACERRPPSVHTATPVDRLRLRAHASTQLCPVLSCAPAAPPNSRRRCLIKPSGSLCSGARSSLPKAWVGDQLHSPLVAPQTVLLLSDRNSISNMLGEASNLPFPPPTCDRSQGSSSSPACKCKADYPATGGLSCHITCRQAASWRATTGVRARDFPAASCRSATVGETPYSLCWPIAMLYTSSDCVHSREGRLYLNHSAHSDLIGCSAVLFTQCPSLF